MTPSSKRFIASRCEVRYDGSSSGPESPGECVQGFVGPQLFRSARRRFFRKFAGREDITGTPLGCRILDFPVIRKSVQIVRVLPFLLAHYVVGDAFLPELRFL